MELCLSASRLLREHAPGTLSEDAEESFGTVKCSFCTIMHGESRGEAGCWEQRLPASHCFSDEQIFKENLSRSVGFSTTAPFLFLFSFYPLDFGLFIEGSGCQIWMPLGWLVQREVGNVCVSVCVLRSTGHPFEHQIPELWHKVCVGQC